MSSFFGQLFDPRVPDQETVQNHSILDIVTLSDRWLDWQKIGNLLDYLIG